MEFSRQKYWSGEPFPSPGDLPDPEIEPTSLIYLLHWQAGSLPLEPSGMSMSSFGCCLITPVPDSSIIIRKKHDNIASRELKIWVEGKTHKNNRIWNFEGQTGFKKKEGMNQRMDSMALIFAAEIFLVLSNEISNAKWCKREKEECD